MIGEAEALGFIGEMSRAMGVNLAIGLNAYIDEPDHFSSYKILIDPSSLSDGDESRLEAYAERKGLTVTEEWSDWGRFIRISKLRTVFVSAFSLRSPHTGR